MEPSQLIEVLAQTKAFIITHPEQAKALLVAHPQLAYALFQALLLNNIVDPAVLQRMLGATTSQPNAPTSYPTPSVSGYQPPPMQHQHMPPPQGMYGQPPVQQQPPPPQPYYRGPAQQAPPQSVPPQVKDLGIDSTHQQMLYQVLQLTPEQINALPPAERDAIQQLRSQFMGNSVPA